MAEDTEYLKLPVQQCCTHKLWKARVHGYTEVCKLFRDEEDEKAAIFSQYAGLLSKFAADSNVVAQEKGLEATLYFIQNSALGGKTIKDILPVIVGKSIAATKKSTQELSAQIVLMYIEIEKQELVLDELLKGLDHKNPKIISACLGVLTTGLKEFGAQVINIKTLLKPVLALLENRDKTVRDDAKVLVVEIYRWIGEAIKPQLAKLPPIVQTELETEFAKVKSGKAVPTRYLRSQQAKQAKVATKMLEDAEDDDVDAGVEIEIDPLSLIDPVNVLSKIPNDFYDKLEAKKWQDRKEAVEAMEKILDHPKLEKGDYGDLVRALLKVISKDANVVVAGLATKCLAKLAAGLKKSYQPYVNATLPQLLAKFKEKKANVVTPLREAVDAVFLATNLEAAQEDIIASLDNKNPSIKAETASYLGRCFAQCTPVILTKKLLKAYATALLKTLNEPDPTVRDCSAEALGIAMKVVGEKVLLPFLPDIDPLKLAKIKECCEKAVVKVVAPVKAAPVKVAAPTAPARAASAPKKVLSGGAMKLQGAKVVKASPPPESEMSPEEVEEKALEYLTEEILKDLAGTDWKTRLENMEKLQVTLTSMEPSPVAAEVMARVLARKPGFKDNNFQVLNLKLDCLKFLAENFPMSRGVVTSLIPDVTEKLGDPKNGSLAGEALMALAEVTNLDIVGELVLENAFSQKSVKVQLEALDWTAEAVQNFGLILSTTTLITYMKKGLNSTNAGVRQSAAGLAGIISMYLGEKLLKLLDEKPAAVSLVNAEMEKRVGEDPLEPSRTCKIPWEPEEVVVVKEAPKVKAKVKEEPEMEDDESEDYPVKDEKSKPAARVDISAKITEQLLSELSDKNWKIRNEALLAIQAMINDAKAIKSNLGELPAALVARFVDSNGKLCSTALEVCTALAVAMGPTGKNQVRNFSRGILTALGDNKAPVRAAALTCLNAWANEAGAKEFFSGEVIPDALKASSSYLKIEIWNWLSEVLPTLKGLPKDELCLLIPHLFSGLEDRNVDVRKAANSAVLGLMMHVGFYNMTKEVEKLKPASKAGITATLEKVRPDVPEATPAKVKPEAKPKAGVKSAPVKSTRQSIAVAPPKPTTRKKEEDVDTSPQLQVNKLKHQRLTDELKLKTLKWNFAIPRQEYVDLLRDQMTAAGFNKTLINNMFHSDFKFHLKALESLSEDLCNEEAFVANLDLLLKWLTLRFFDTNPSVLLKGLEYLQTAFTMLINSQYIMGDLEASCFIPYLVLKVGDPKDTVRDRVHTIIKQFSHMYTPNKLFLLIMDGLKSKNSRQRTECLDELGYLIEQFGTSVCGSSPAVALKEISKQIADRDNAVRSAALNAIVKAYYVEGDKIYKMIGQLSDKDLSYLEERIKRASQNRLKAQKEERTMIVPQKVEKKEKFVEPEVESEKEESPVPEEPEPEPVYQPPSRALPSPYKFPERPPTRLPKLDLVEIDYSFLDEPLYIPENIRRKMANIAPANPAVERMLSDVSSLNLEVAFEGLKKLYTVLNNSETEENLACHSKNIFSAISIQLKACNTYSSATHGAILGQVYKIILRTIGDIFGKSSFANKADEQDLKVIIQEMLVAFVDDKTVEFVEGGYNQWIILFLSKVLTSSDMTAVTCAAVNALYDLVGTPPQNPKLTELTTKCLLKVIAHMRKAPVIDEVLDLDKVLYSCHLFMQAYPRHTWKDRPTDLPLKAVKTLLMHLVQKKGSDILLHIRSIENPIGSELAAYLKKMIVSQPSGNKLTKPMTDQLSEIFLKIGSDPKVGMVEFYEFKKKYPDADLTQIMSTTSQYFQDFVADSLKEIERERGPLLSGRGSHSSSQKSADLSHSATAPVTVSEPPKDITKAAQYYLDVLRSHQAKLGVPLSNLPGFEPYDPEQNPL